MDLVLPEPLDRAVREVSNYLTTTYPRLKVAFNSPAFYYDNSKPMFNFKDDELTVYVRIPVVSGEHLFRVIKVISCTDQHGKWRPERRPTNSNPASSRGCVLDKTVLYTTGQR